MIQEDYVTFEQAKLLKEKGFPQNFNYNFVYNKSRIKEFYNPQQIYRNMNVIACPTLYLTQQWLIEKGIYIQVMLNGYLQYFPLLQYTQVVKKTEKPSTLVNGLYNTYEEALSAGIDKALELI